MLRFFRRRSIADRNWSHSVAGGWGDEPYDREHAQAFVDELEAHTEHAVRSKWNEQSHEHKRWSARFSSVSVHHPHRETGAQTRTYPAVPFVGEWLKQKERERSNYHRLLRGGAYAAIIAAIFAVLAWFSVKPEDLSDALLSIKSPASQMIDRVISEQ